MTKDLTAERLQRESAAARDLMAAIASDDETLNHDMIEGETSLFEAVQAALSEIDECDIIAEGCKAKEKEIADRRARAERRTERLRAMIEQALVITELMAMKLPTATITVRQVPPKYLIEDESVIPPQFWRRPDPVLDRKAISDAFKDGTAIPGVGQTNGGTSLQIRRA